MSDPISPQQFHESDGLDNWRVLGDGASIYLRTGSFAESARLVQAIGEIPGIEDHPPAIDLRAGGVTVRLVSGADDYYGMTERDVRVAQQISAVARDLGLSADPSAGRILDRRHVDVGRVHALCEIPAPLAPDAAGDRNLAPHHQELRHLSDVAAVRPPSRRPRHDRRIRDVARAQGAGCVCESIEDVATKGLVVAEPGASLLVRRPLGSAGEEEAQVAHRSHHRVDLEQSPVPLKRLLEVVRPI